MIGFARSQLRVSSWCRLDVDGVTSPFIPTLPCTAPAHCAALIKAQATHHRSGAHTSPRMT